MINILKILFVPIFSLTLFGCSNQSTQVEKSEILNAGSLTQTQLEDTESYNLDIVYYSDFKQEIYDEYFYMIDGLMDIAEENMQSVLLGNVDKEELKPYEEEPVRVIRLKQDVNSESLHDEEDVSNNRFINQIIGIPNGGGNDEGVFILDKNGYIYKNVKLNDVENGIPTPVIYETDNAIIYYTGTHREKITDLVLNTFKTKEAIKIYKEYLK